MQLLFIDYFINVESQTRSVPQLPTSTSAFIQAGYKKSTFGEAAQLCLQPTERNVQTPEEISKYRKSFKEQFGVTIVASCIYSATLRHCWRPPSSQGISLRHPDLEILGSEEHHEGWARARRWGLCQAAQGKQIRVVQTVRSLLF